MTNYFDWPTNEPQPFESSSSGQTEPEEDAEQPVIGNSNSELEPKADSESEWRSESADYAADTSSDESDDELTPMIGIVSAMMTEVDADTEPDEADPRSTAQSGDAELEIVEDVAFVVTPLAPESPQTEVEAVQPINVEPMRIAVLTDAIERRPDAPANYVLRGEAYLELSRYEEAAQDFTAALGLAEDRQTDWEYLNRLFLDRARQGLRRIGR